MRVEVMLVVSNYASLPLQHQIFPSCVFVYLLHKVGVND